MSVGQPCLFKNEVSMAKAKNTAFFCKECGYESSKWLGQCPECRQWNTFVEEPVVKQTVQGNIRGIAHRDVMPSVLSGISLDEEERTLTGYSELDRVLGGGIVRGSLVLVGGDVFYYYSGYFDRKRIWTVFGDFRTDIPKQCLYG